MVRRLVRAGFLLLVSLIVKRFPVAEERPRKTLESLASHEADFRACDRDWNQVNDFWTIDLYSRQESETDQSD